MNKNFEIENDSEEKYLVNFNDEGGEIKASCNCQAGQYCKLCRHVIKCMLEDDEINEALENYGLLGIYKDYLIKNEEADKLKEEAKKIKRKFSRILLGNYRDKK